MNLNKNIILKVKFKNFYILYILILIGGIISFFNFFAGKLIVISISLLILYYLFFCYKIIISKEKIKLFYLFKKNIEYSFDEISKINIFFSTGRYSEDYMKIYTDKKHIHIVTPLGSYLYCIYCILKKKDLEVKMYANGMRPNRPSKVNCDNVLKNAKKKKYYSYEETHN